MGLDKLQCYKLLRALVALKEVAFLLSWQFEQKFVSCKGFLFYLDVLLQCFVSVPLLFNGLTNSHCVRSCLFVMLVKRYSQCFEIVLSIEKVFNSQL